MSKTESPWEKAVPTIPHQPSMGMWGSDTSKWADAKDLSEYKVEKILARDDADWLQYNDSHKRGIIDFGNPTAEPRALQEDMLDLWRPDNLRPAIYRPFSSQATLGGTWCPGSSSTSPAVTALSSTTGSMKGGRSAKQRLSIRTMIAAGGIPGWAESVQPKLQPQHFATRSSSAPVLPVKPTNIYEDPAKSLLQRSMLSLGQQDHLGHSAHLDTAISSDPRHIPAWRQRSVARGIGGDHSGVISDCNEAVRLDSAHARSWGRRAEAKLSNGDIKGAKADCDQAIFRDTHNSKVWHTRAVARFMAGDIDDGIDDCDRAIRIEPRVAEYWSDRAAGKVQVEDFELAEKDCDEALRLDARHLKARVTRAAARNGLGKHQEAISDCDRALKIDKNCVPALAHRAYARRYVGDLDGATADCNRAIALNPGFAPALCTRGEVKFERGDYMEAIKDFDKGIDVDPKYARLWWYRGKTHMIIGRYDAAQADSAQAYALEPRLEDAKNDAEVAGKHLKNVSSWRLPIVHRGLQGELEHQDRLKNPCAKK